MSIIDNVEHVIETITPAVEDVANVALPIVEQATGMAPLPLSLGLNLDSAKIIWHMVNFVLSNPHPFNAFEVAIMNDIKYHIIGTLTKPAPGGN
jgi:hypothetical protein